MTPNLQPSQVPVWSDYQRLVGPSFKLHEVERFSFYDRAKRSFAVVATGETALYGNIILKKGVVEGED